LHFGTGRLLAQARAEQIFFKNLLAASAIHGYTLFQNASCILEQVACWRRLAPNKFSSKTCSRHRPSMADGDIIDGLVI